MERVEPPVKQNKLATLTLYEFFSLSYLSSLDLILKLHIEINNFTIVCRISTRWGRESNLKLNSEAIIGKTQKSYLNLSADMTMLADDIPSGKILSPFQQLPNCSTV